jgi:hypothetical protein
MRRTFKKVDYDRALESFGAAGRLSASLRIWPGSLLDSVGKP